MQFQISCGTSTYNIETNIMLLLYIIAFIGFIENINSKSKIKIEYFEKHNINTNIVKIIVLSILSLILLWNCRTKSTAIVLALVYFSIVAFKVMMSKNKKYIKKLWKITGISVISLILVCSIYLGLTNTFDRTITRLIANFNPKIAPNGEGWQGILQKDVIESAKLFGKIENTNNIEYSIFNAENEVFPIIAMLANYGIILTIGMIIAIIAFSIKLIFDTTKIKDLYGKLLIIGIASSFILRSILCILMNLNLGIKSDFKIPFVSCGKEELIIDMISLAIVFSVYRRKNIILGMDKQIEE